MSFFKKTGLSLALTTLLISGAVYAKAPEMQIVNPDSLKWTDIKKLPGAQVAILYGNPEKKGPYVARVKLPADYYIPAHSHPVNENETVISGTLYMGMGTKEELSQGQALTAGSFLMIPAKMEHAVLAKEETVIQISGMGPWGMQPKKKS